MARYILDTHTHSCFLKYIFSFISLYLWTLKHSYCTASIIYNSCGVNCTICWFADVSHDSFFLKWGVLDFEFIFSWSNFPQESHLLYFSGWQTTRHGAVLHLPQPGVIIFIFHKCIGSGLRENRVIPIPFD